MSTDDSGAANPDLHPGTDPDTESNASLSQPSVIPTTPKTSKTALQVAPDTLLRQSSFATEDFRSADLDGGRGMLQAGLAHAIRLPIDCLWTSYSPKEGDLRKVKEHLTENGFLIEGDRWDRAKIVKKHFETKCKTNEVQTFAFFSDLFNVVLDSLRPTHPTFVKKMVNAGHIGPESTRINSSRPDAFLRVDVDENLKTGKFKWRDLTCPFEYKFGDGDAVDVRQHEPTTR
jgi:hypothetical protein